MNARLVVTRVLSAALVAVGVVSVVFLLIHLVPGDPVEVMLGEGARPADREALRSALGLDRPLHRQWLDYLGGLARLDLGRSLHSQRPVFDLLAERVPGTALLAGAALVLAIAIALPLGLAAALRPGTIWDRATIAFASAGVAVPNFWMGPMLIIVFSIALGWFPVTGLSGPRSLVLPALTLGTALAAVLARMVRASVLEVLAEDWVRTARAKGLAPRAVLLAHVLPNALLPVVTVLGLQLGALLGGAVVTETVFAWPGLGRLTVEAIVRRDYPVLQGCVLLISLTYVAVNTSTDLLYGIVDPRTRSAA